MSTREEPEFFDGQQPPELTHAVEKDRTVFVYDPEDCENQFIAISAAHAHDLEAEDWR